MSHLFDVSTTPDLPKRHYHAEQPCYLNLLASRSDSSKHRMSFSRTARRLDQQGFFTRIAGKYKYLPGPLTLRIMLRDWSSIKSTRTCVTPPREPIQEVTLELLYGLEICSCSRSQLTSSAEDAGNSDKLNGNLGRVHICRLSLRQSVLDFG